MVAKKRHKLKKNFYYTSDGTIQFRKMIRGKLITGRTGMTDPHKVNKHAEEIRHQIIAHHYKLQEQQTKQPNYNTLVNKWIATKQGLSKRTLETYYSNVNYYINNGISTDVSTSRVNALRRDYNIFARWCKKEGYEVDIIKGKTNSEARTRVLNDNELNRLWIACDMEGTQKRYKKKHQDFKDCLQFIFYTGARRKEVKAPKKEWLRKNNDGNYYLQVVRKGGNKRIIRINKQALRILEQRNFEFWSYSDDWLTRRYQYMAKKANIKDTILHDLRRTFGYKLLVGGTDIAIVARLLGIDIKVAYKHYTPLLVSEIDNFTI